MMNSVRFPLSALFLLLLSAVTTAQTPCAPTDQQAVKAMTYNLRLDTEQDGPNAWPLRRDMLAAQVRLHSPDVLGIQEGLPQQVEWLNRELEAYQVVGQGRNGGNEGEYSAIYFDRRRFALLDSGTFWLSPTGEPGSMGWDAAYPRICTWAKLSDRNGAGTFVVFNTHFDHRGEKARVESARLIMEMVDSLAGPDLPHVVMGDLNLTPDSAPIQVLSDSLQDAYSAAANRFGPEGTFTGFEYAARPRRRIDYIFASPDVEVQQYAVLSDAVDGRFPSDHFPVVASLNLRPRPTIIAHRGASGHAPENTLAAFQEAVDLGADMIELDVFALEDGSVVCFHDTGLTRLTGATGNLTDLTLAEISQLRVAGHHPIPLLEDVLRLVDKRLRINVELKGPDTAEPTYAIIQRFIRDHGWKISDFHISSFRHDQLRKMRTLDARIDIGILPHGNPLGALDLAKEIGAYSINAYHGALNAETLTAMHKAGLKVYAWTVNDAAEIIRLLELGIDGFITNYPDRVCTLAAE